MLQWNKDLSEDEMEIAEELLDVDPESPTPHLDKLKKLDGNKKIPESDRRNIEEAIKKYEEWQRVCAESELEGEDLLRLFVEEVNKYKKFIEYDLIWMSDSNFLYRSKGQLKLDNSIIEEFLPMLMDKRIISQLGDINYERGPKKSFASMFITNNLIDVKKGIQIGIRTKDQDFTLGRRLYLKASVNKDFTGKSKDFHIYLAFAAAECKTNLDKTMFQEAVSTSHDLKTFIPGSKYFLVCEWIDMKPIDTRSTDIDEVLILRGKRIASKDRKNNSSSKHRKENAEAQLEFLDKNPIRFKVIQRFVKHISDYLSVKEEDVESVSDRGYF